jgi:alpha-methylacyl-CoA racemase
MAEAVLHPQNLAHRTFVEVDGVLQSNAGPRFSRTPGSVKSGPTVPGQHTDEVLRSAGFTESEIAGLRNVGAVA